MNSDEPDAKVLGGNFPSGNLIFIIERAREGHRRSFEELISLFQGEIFRMIYYRTRSRLDSEDLAQEVFIRAFKNIHKLKNAESFRSWLYGIAINCVRDFHRKWQFRRFFERVGEGSMQEEQDHQLGPDSPQAHLLNKEFWQNIKQMSARFSKMEREVFFLRFMDHLSIKEISNALQRDESTIKTYMYRSLKKFREDKSLLSILQGDA